MKGVNDMRIRKFRKILLSICSVLSLASVCGACISLRGGKEVAVADTQALPTTVTGTATEAVTGEVSLSSFTMNPGASVRIKEPAGLRFMTNISSEDLAKLPTNAQFGTLIIPSNKIDGALTLATQYTSKGTVDKWSERSTEDVYKYNSVLKFPTTASSFYGREMTARSYVTYTDSLGDTYTLYASASQSYSMAYVASCDLADGLTESLLKEICDTVVGSDGLQWQTSCNSLQVGQSVQIAHDATDSSGKLLKAIYASNDACVSVNEDGVLVGVSKGTATITATVGSYSATMQITVGADVANLEAGEKVVHNFDDSKAFGDTFETSHKDDTLVLNNANSISGNSLFIDNTNGAPSVAFMKNNQMTLNGKYKVTFDYKVLTATMPDYFCVGFNGTAQQNRENWFSGRSDAVGTTYQFEHTFELAEGKYYLQIFSFTANGSQIVIDNIAIENVTPTDTQTLADLNVTGGKITHDFDKKVILGDFTSSVLANSTVSTANAISGNSLLLDNTGSAPTVKFLENNKLSLNGQYKVTFDYKVLTTAMPDYFCVGFNGTAQVNRENWFSGRTDTVGTIYQFEYTFTLTEGTYYLQMFSLGANGAQIVIDNIIIENVTPADTQTLANLNTVGGKVTHDFDDKVILGDFTSSVLANSTVSSANAISGNSLLLNNTDSAPTVKFLGNNMLSLSGQYKVTFDYKVLTATMPDYFCVGFNGTAQVNRENWFSGRTDAIGETYQFEYTFTLTEGTYYLQMFSLGANGAQIVIDNIVIEKVA